MKTQQLEKKKKLREYSNKESCLLKWFQQCLDIEETLRKYIEGNEGMEDLFKPLGILKNKIVNNVLNKQRQLTLHQFFKNDNM